DGLLAGAGAEDDRGPEEVRQGPPGRPAAPLQPALLLRPRPHPEAGPDRRDPPRRRLLGPRAGLEAAAPGRLGGLLPVGLPDAQPPGQLAALPPVQPRPDDRERHAPARRDPVAPGRQEAA